MPALSLAIATVMGAFAPLFSKRVFEHAMLLLEGAMPAPGRRTVAAVWRVMGQSQDGHLQNYHRVLNRPRWSPINTGRVLLGLLLDRARQAVGLVRGWLRTGEVVVVGHSRYAALEWLDALRESIGVITPLRLDARL